MLVTFARSIIDWRRPAANYFFAQSSHRKTRQFEALPQHLPGGAEEDNGKLNSGESVSGPRFEHGMSRIGNRSATYSMTTLGYMASWCQFISSSIPWEEREYWKTIRIEIGQV